MMSTNNTFQLSALSQNDPMVADGSKLYCKITNITNGTLRAGSFPMNKDVHLPIPPGQDGPVPTPTWFLESSQNADSTFTIEVFCPTDETYPAKTITITESDVKAWASVPFNDRVNQIYQEGEYGIFGFAQEGPDGLIYTITAGVLNPRLHGNTTTV